MINIAVCDDDVQFAAALEEKILDYGKRKGVRLDTEVFSDGESFRQAVFNDSFYRSIQDHSIQISPDRWKLPHTERSAVRLQGSSGIPADTGTVKQYLPLNHYELRPAVW